MVGSRTSRNIAGEPIDRAFLGRSSIGMMELGEEGFISFQLFFSFHYVVTNVFLSGLSLMIFVIFVTFFITDYL